MDGPPPPLPSPPAPSPDQVAEGCEGYSSDGVEEEEDEQQQLEVAKKRIALSMTSFGALSANLQQPPRPRRHLTESEMQSLARALRRAAPTPSSAPQQSSTRSSDYSARRCVSRTRPPASPAQTNPREPHPPAPRPAPAPPRNGPHP